MDLKHSCVFVFKDCINCSENNGKEDERGSREQAGDSCSGSSDGDGGLECNGSSREEEK